MTDPRKALLLHLTGAAALASLTVTCGGEPPAPPPAPPDLPVTRFDPPGCPFAVAPRPEYTEVSVGRTEVGATPNIRRVRLGLGGNVAVDAPGRADPATSIALAWQTDDGTLASEVQWGTTPDPATWPAGNRQSGMTWITPAGLISETGPTRMHEAYVCGLAPDTTYHYRVGGGPEGQEVWSDVLSFKTAPAGGADAVRFAVTGDSRGQSNDAWRLIQRRVMASNVDMQLFSGDFVGLPFDQIEWELWLDAASKDTDGAPLTLGQVLTLPAHGNHENHSSLFFSNVTMPQDVDRFPAWGELFFSFDAGPVHLVVLDDAWLVNPADQPDFEAAFTEWLHADLTAAEENRAQVPWIIAVHHHGPYSSSNHGTDVDVLRGRALLGPIYDEHHVDLVLNGHDHNYERTRPLTTDPSGVPQVQPGFADGTVYVVCAGAGAPAYSAGTSEFTETSRDYKTGGALGNYGLLEATRNELRFEAHELRLDATDPVFDTLIIPR
ncbi:purple acid phosphatase family protein [Chondromyces apiculatus]|uniref:Metallophosphoesterase/PKD domain protein n=1 Tax=Chondromyces apiculatus DSM 436 TaxID=1192034 RepID=A0A017SWE8_9BACT|nr:metallophosphoesterase family protein [Chondromyces apiculatus]EYF00626.1 metallophosphoesterase/PKD domain protein [Chondromyces apiculatus DSM 436]